MPVLVRRPSAARPAARTMLGAVLAALLLTLLGAVPAAASPAAEADFLARLNAARSAAGLPGLAPAGDLATVARAHAERMARENRLYHNPNLAAEVTNWTSVGENVGYGGSVQRVHDALYASPGHRANMLSGSFTQVGIGVATANGRVWVTQVFRQPARGGFPLVGAIGATYSQFAGTLGAPTSAEYDVRGGRAQRFERGEILWSWGTGAHEVHGGILGKYREVGGPSSALGLPTTSEHGAPGGRMNRFQGGQIVWSPATGAWSVQGGISGRYDEIGGSGSPLGSPTSDEKAASHGRVSLFQRGRIYWSPGTGAREVYGAILGRYLATGGSAGSLGFPTSGEYDVPGGRRTDFERGSITWHATTGGTTLTVR